MDALKDKRAVLKTNRYFHRREFKNYAYSQAQNEALVMLQTHSSKRTMTLYGLCGTSTLVEPGNEIEKTIIPNNWKWVSQETLDEQQTEDVKPMNGLSPEEKLHVATVMAESIAELHGNREGVIVSHDIGFDQWLRSKKDGLIKFNDFNKAHILKWNPETQQYCKFWSHQVR